MISSDYTRNLFITDSSSRIVMLVIDGLGGLPHPDSGRSELETANLPNLDALCARGSTGLISPRSRARKAKAAVSPPPALAPPIAIRPASTPGSPASQVRTS